MWVATTHSLVSMFSYRADNQDERLICFDI